jgi:hypothetical protein
MDAGRFTGRKTVTFYVPMGADTLRLRVSAESRADLVLNPGRLDFGVVPQGQRSTKTTEIAHAGNADWRVTLAEGDSSALDVQVEESYRGPGQVGYRVRVRLKADTPVGPLQQEVRLKTNDPVTPLISLPVVGMVQAPWTVAPADLDFGTGRVGDSRVRRVVVRANKPFKILAVEGLGEDLGADWSVEPAVVQIIQFHYKPTRAGKRKVVLRIYTDMGTAAEVSITGEATVAP